MLFVCLFVYLCIVNDSFCPTTPELNSCVRDILAYKVKNTYYLKLYRKSLLTFAGIEETSVG